MLRVWDDGNFVTYTCARCGETGWAKDGATRSRSAAPKQEAPVEPEADKSETARFLWERSKPARGTIVEKYLRSRQCWIESPTIRYLPARGDHAPAMISRFGTGQVTGIHLTRLKGDGGAKAGTESDKIMLGPSIGQPIALAPVNDGLGLVIAEGIEDALSAHLATGLGAWAAGSASRMPALADAVPSYVECVTILVDDDEAGRKRSATLADRLRGRCAEVRLLALSDEERLAA